MFIYEEFKFLENIFFRLQLIMYRVYFEFNLIVLYIYILKIYFKKIMKIKDNFLKGLFSNY